jgi:probable HAF family extracellular repeat protein
MKHARHWLLATACAAAAFHPLPSQAQDFDWQAHRLPWQAEHPLLPRIHGAALAVTDINNSGQVVGWSSAGIDPQAFVYDARSGYLRNLGLGGLQSQATAINAAGQVVGWATLQGSTTRHAFISSPGQGTQRIVDPNGMATEAVGINENGHVISRAPIRPELGYSSYGTVYDGTTVRSAGPGWPIAINNHGTVLGQFVAGTSQAPWIYLEPGGGVAGLPGWGRFATDLNDAGQVLGHAGPDGEGRSHAFVSANGEAVDLGNLGGLDIRPQDLNNAGQAVGWASLADNSRHAFLWNAGTMTDLGTLGGRNSVATAVNELGQVVGFSEVAPGSSERHAFFYSDGQMIDLTEWLELSFNEAAGLNSASIVLNDLGQIALDTIMDDGTRGIFLLTPIPEPSLYALMLAGLGALAMVRQRRRF